MEKREGLDCDFLSRVYTPEAIDIFENEVIRKRYDFDVEEGKKFARLFASEPGNPLNYWFLLEHVGVLLSQLFSIRVSDVEFQFYYIMAQRDKSRKEDYESRHHTNAAYCAEIFFLRWFSYFEKLSHVMNYPIGFRFRSRPKRLTRGRKKKVPKKRTQAILMPFLRNIQIYPKGKKGGGKHTHVLSGDSQ